MKKKLKIKEINASIDAFQCDVICLIGDHEQILPWAKKNLTTKYYEYIKDHLDKFPIRDVTKGRMIGFTGGGSLIWLREYHLPTAVHESVHSIQHLMREKNIEECEHNDEVSAYMVEYIFKRILNNK